MTMEAETAVILVYKLVAPPMLVRSLEVDNTRRSTQQEHMQLLEENHQLHEALHAKDSEIKELLATQDQLVEMITTLEAGQVMPCCLPHKKVVVHVLII